MPPGTDSISAKRQVIAKTEALELLSSSLLLEILSPGNFDPTTIKAETLDLACAAVKRLNSLVHNGSPEVQAHTLDFIKNSLAGETSSAVAETVIEGMVAGVDKAVATKAQDLLQVLALLCHALVSIRQHQQAQAIATSLVHQVLGNGSTSQLRAAGAKPAILILWSMQSFAPVECLPSTLIADVLAAIDVSGESAYRSRLLSGLVQNEAYLRKLGFQSSEEAAAPLLKQWYQPGRLSRSDLSAISIHLLPLLLQQHPKLAKSILQDLRDSTTANETAGKFAYIPAWTAIARVGVATCGLKLADLDSSSLECAMHHGDDDIRLGAWFILSRCQSPTDQIEDIALGEDGLLSQWLSSNMAVPILEFRNDFLASFGRFVERLYTSANAAIRQSQKPVALSKKGDAMAERELEDHRKACKAYTSRVVDFVHLLLDRFIDRSIFLPMSTYHARIVTALSMLSYLQEHLGSRQVPKKGGKNQVTWPSIYTEERVESLIACLGSNFTDVRNLSAEILQRAPDPLPGFRDPSHQEMILETALERLNGARNTDAEAGGLLIQVLFHNLQEEGAASTSSGHLQQTSSQLQLFFIIYGRLDKRLGRISGSATLEEEPLHGLLLALIRIIFCWPASMKDFDYSGIGTRILRSAEQIWDICRPIIATQQGDDNQHEIAGAYDMLDENVHETEQAEGSKADNIHLTILSNCWRAIKETSNLVALFFEKLPGEAVTPELASSAGDLYMRWLRHIRHRGTFSSMTTAFEKFLDAPIVLKERRKGWLRQQLEFIATGEAATTRRSGALPYAVLALVHTDANLFDEAFLHLSSIVKTSLDDPAKIHAMHSLRVMLLDARHSHIFKRYFEESIILALDAYRTDNWSVRNAALLLSANITNRAIGKPLNDLAHKSSRRPTLHEWIKLYPRTLSHFEMILDRSRDIDAMDPATFIVLLILRSLDTVSTGHASAVSPSLLQKLKPLLDKREIKARQVAAQALANLMNLDEAISIAQGLCSALEKQQRKGLNGIHGCILVLEGFLSSRQLDIDSRSAIVKFRSRFMAVATSGQWPQLITQGLLALISDLEGWASASREESILTPGDATPAEVIRLLTQGATGWAIPSLMETIRLLVTPRDKSTLSSDSDISNRLFQTYLSTSNKPLQEALLPILGFVASNSSDPGRNAEVLKLIQEAGQDYQSEDSRQAAVSALQPFANQLQGFMPQNLFSIADLLLRDDAANIRLQAAGFVGIALQIGYPICAPKAEETLWNEATRRFRSSVDFAERLLTKKINLQDIQQLHMGLVSQTSDLFAEEPANLYIEPYSRKQQLFIAFCKLDEAARNHTLTACQDRIRLFQKQLNALSNVMGGNVTLLDKRRESRILLQQMNDIVKSISA